MVGSNQLAISKGSDNQYLLRTIYVVRVLCLVISYLVLLVVLYKNLLNPYVFELISGLRSSKVLKLLYHIEFFQFHQLFDNKLFRLCYVIIELTKPLKIIAFGVQTNFQVAHTKFMLFKTRLLPKMIELGHCLT